MEYILDNTNWRKLKFVLEKQMKRIDSLQMMLGP